jgi:hypothetical protein
MSKRQTNTFRINALGSESVRRSMRFDFNIRWVTKISTFSFVFYFVCKAEKNLVLSKDKNGCLSGFHTLEKRRKKMEQDVNVNVKELKFKEEENLLCKKKETRIASNGCSLLKCRNWFFFRWLHHLFSSLIYFHVFFYTKFNINDKRKNV